MPLDHAVDEPLAVGFVGDIAGDGVGARDLLGERRQPVGATRGQDRGPAGVADGPRELGAKAGARPRDDDDMTVEWLHSILSAEVSSTVSRRSLERNRRRLRYRQMGGLDRPGRRCRGR